GGGRRGEKKKRRRATARLRLALRNGRLQKAGPTTAKRRAWAAVTCENLWRRRRWGERGRSVRRGWECQRRGGGERCQPRLLARSRRRRPRRGRCGFLRRPL